MTRRVLVRILLSLLLLASQQMAFTHALSHSLGARPEAASASAAPSAAQKLSVDQLCEQCLAFAQIASALGSNARSFAAPEQTASAIAFLAPVDACPRHVCNFRSRAPPFPA